MANLEGRTTIRLTMEVFNRLNEQAARDKRSTNQTIDTLLKDALGILGNYPIVIKTGEEYVWINPFSYFGPMDAATATRFLNGRGLPFRGDLWDEAWETIDECVEALEGQLVCHQAHAGAIIIDDYPMFRDMLEKLGI